MAGSPTDRMSLPKSCDSTDGLTKSGTDDAVALAFGGVALGYVVLGISKVAPP